MKKTKRQDLEETKEVVGVKKAKNSNKKKATSRESKIKKESKKKEIKKQEKSSGENEIPDLISNTSFGSNKSSEIMGKQTNIFGDNLTIKTSDSEGEESVGLKQRRSSTTSKYAGSGVEFETFNHGKIKNNKQICKATSLGKQKTYTDSYMRSSKKRKFKEESILTHFSKNEKNEEENNKKRKIEENENNDPSKNDWEKTNYRGMWSFFSQIVYPPQTNTEIVENTINDFDVKILSHIYDENIDDIYSKKGQLSNETSKNVFKLENFVNTTSSNNEVNVIDSNLINSWFEKIQSVLNDVGVDEKSLLIFFSNKEKFIKKALLFNKLKDLIQKEISREYLYRKAYRDTFLNDLKHPILNREPPNLEECSPEYIKKYLREPFEELRWERECKNDGNCVGILIAQIFPDNSKESSVTEAFVLREFLTPSEEYNADVHNILPPMRKNCILCNRLYTQTNVWWYHKNGIEAQEVLQDHYVTIGENGYSKNICIPPVSNAGNKVGIIAPFPRFNFHDYTSVKMEVSLLSKDTNTIIKKSRRAVIERFYCEEDITEKNEKTENSFFSEKKDEKKEKSEKKEEIEEIDTLPILEDQEEKVEDNHFF
jgi:hypothetical protein